MISRDDLEAFGYYNENVLPKRDDYSKWVETMIVTEGETRLIENTLGLVGEAGEVAEKIKKRLRDGSEVKPYEIIKEIGDVVFYATALANAFGSSLADVMKVNQDKLNSRKERGTIRGSGDNR
jgi:NTP pyrophosphatase (non-canonical NTP hydrolase)